MRRAVAKVVVSPVEDQEKAEGDGDTFDVKYPANLVLKASTPTRQVLLILWKVMLRM